MTQSQPDIDYVRTFIKNSAAILVWGLVGSIVLLILSQSAFSWICVSAFLGYVAYRSFTVTKWRKDPELLPLVEQARLEFKEIRQKARASKSLLVNYETGLESFNLKGSYSISTYEDGLHFKRTFGKDNFVIPWRDLTEVEAGSEADLRSRVTVSRLLLTGIFAFGLKKERKKGFYISVATNNSIGLFSLNTSGSNNRANEKKARIFAATCNAKIRELNGDEVTRIESQNSSSVGEIEKLGELLGKGLLSEEEFTKAKKKILGI